MSFATLFFVIAVIIFAVEAWRTHSLIAAGLAVFAAAHVVAGSIPLK